MGIMQMETEQQEYKGHNIELRKHQGGTLQSFGVENTSEPELLIDGESVQYGQLPDGSYALREYAYDWEYNLMELAKKLIDYREIAEKNRLVIPRKDK